jgi:hypothetical protein
VIEQVTWSTWVQISGRSKMRIQFGRTLGIASITFGLLMLAVQGWLWFRTYNPPPSSKKVNTSVLASSDPAPTKLPAILGGVALVGGIVVFAHNLRRPQDLPVRPAHRV